ncbi:MAG: hypothetical protein QOG86_695 [Thermoleophilaceae bacterium]|nr:hypothetical protein [Thermoleophilaceae bacterium]
MTQGIQRRALVTVLAAVAALGSSGCGDGSKSPGSAARKSTTTAATAPAKPRSSTPAPRPKRRRVTIRVPRGFHVSRHPVTRSNWPAPLTVATSFPVHRASANALCPTKVLESFPPDGVYMLVAEFTKPRPKGIPPRRPLPPRGDLRHLDIRPSEVECWDGGPSGAKDFTENGRSFRVELLLGSRVSAARRRAALEALGSLRIPAS